jgi:hypothetical protein
VRVRTAATRCRPPVGQQGQDVAAHVLVRARPGLEQVPARHHPDDLAAVERGDRLEAFSVQARTTATGQLARWITARLTEPEPS